VHRITTMDRGPSLQAVYEAAARLQELIPDAVLVGGTAAAYHAGHRVSFDDDHVVADLTSRYDEVLTALEETDGWVTARVKRPVMILGRIDRYYDDQVGSSGRRVATQVAKQLAEPRPFDLSDVDLRSYRRLEHRWHDWSAVADACRRVAVRVLDALAGEWP